MQRKPGSGGRQKRISGSGSVCASSKMTTLFAMLWSFRQRLLRLA